MKFPVDFEEKVKMPASDTGLGYPYQLKAKDLMANFRAAALQVGDGLKEETSISGIRTVSLDGEGGGGLPEGEQGDMLYYSGSEWVTLPAEDTSLEEDAFLIHGGFSPLWKKLDIKTLQYVGDDNTAETGRFYMIPELPE